MHLKYLSSKDEFSIDELGHLLLALGFPKDLFSKNLQKEMFTDGSLSTKTLLKCCELHYFNKDLHFTLNLKSGSYNNEILKKSIVLLSEQIFSFSDLQNVRLAFETYEEYDQKGMSLREKTLLRTLKLCNRVISPQKLMNKLRHIQSAFKEKGRIQFYEFLDLLWWCEQASIEEIVTDEEVVLEKTWRDVYCVDNFRKFVLPKDKRVWKALNEQYEHEELKYEHPTLHSEAFVDLPVKAEDFKTQVRLANKDHLTIQKKLKDSDKQIKLAKGGSSQTRPRPKTALSSSTLKSKPVKSSESATSLSGITWAVHTPRVNPNRSPSATTITGVPTFRSMPIEMTDKPDRKFLARSSSCPPVVNSQSRDEVTKQMERIRFEMQTKEQRWEKSFKSEISKYISNYDEVLERIRRSPPAPGKRKYRRPKQPPDATIQRLAQPKPLMPQSHVTHCDAITMGMGKDEHARALQRQGRRLSPRSGGDEKRTKRKRKSSKPKWNSLSHRNASLLERLLDEIDKESVTQADVETSRDEILEIPDRENPPEKDVPTCEVTTDILSCREEHLSELEAVEETQESVTTTPRSVAYFRKPHDWKLEALEAMEGDFSRIFLDPAEEKSRAQDPEQHVPFLPCGVTHEHFSRPPSGRSVESQTTEVTEFEKFLGDPENLRIPDDVFIGNTTKSEAHLRKRRKSLARIAGRFEGKEKANAKLVLKTKKSSHNFAT